jgi:hypothetical protein
MPGNPRQSPKSPSARTPPGLRVEITALDDFMYSEPLAIVPEPGSAVMILLGIVSLAILPRRPPRQVVA